MSQPTHTKQSLQSLKNEPIRLALESERVNNELEALVLDNYKVFIENLTCSSHLSSKDKKINEMSTELNDKLGLLNNACSFFKDRVNHFVNLHKRNRKTLQHQSQLVELLEVPQLVDACARNGKYFSILILKIIFNANNLSRIS